MNAEQNRRPDRSTKWWTSSRGRVRGGAKPRAHKGAGKICHIEFVFIGKQTERQTTRQKADRKTDRQTQTRSRPHEKYVCSFIWI